jgi:DNA-binding MarR family transcriptional regulator
MRAQFTLVTGEFELSPTQARALLRLAEPVSMRWLANRLRCDASHVTGVVDGLERRGLVRRETSAVDRRVRRIVLTARGHQVRDQLHARLRADVPAVAGLGAADRAALYEILRRATSAL